MNLSFAVNSPLLAEPFVVQRSTGQWVAGGWQANPPANLQYWGIISPNNKPKEIEAVPEADRVHGVITINCELPLYTTRASGPSSPGTSDIIVWNGEQYRIYEVFLYQSRGYYWACAARIVGD